MEVIEHINQLGAVPLSTAQLFNPAIINVVRQIVAGDRFAYDDPNLNEVMDAITEMLQDKGVATWINYLPHWFVEQFFGLLDWDKCRECVKISKKYFVTMVEERLGQYKSGSTIDFIDSYITMVNSTFDPDSSFFKKAGHENLVHMIFNFFDAGVETTSTATSWVSLFLAPPAHSKYKAFLQEVLRKSSAVPLALLHRSLENVRLNSFFIPKNTVVISNLFGLHHDPIVWGNDVEEFRPQRFLPLDGYTVAPHRHDPLPFGAGKRFCPGDNVARSELFLFTIATLQKFSVCELKCKLTQMRTQMHHIQQWNKKLEE